MSDQGLQPGERWSIETREINGVEQAAAIVSNATSSQFPVVLQPGSGFDEGTGCEIRFLDAHDWELSLLAAAPAMLEALEMQEDARRLQDLDATQGVELLTKWVEWDGYAAPELLLAEFHVLRKRRRREAIAAAKGDPE